MTALVHPADGVIKRPVARAHSPYVVELSSDWSSVASEWSGAATPFQDAAWLGAWCRALGDRPDVMPLLVTARRRDNGEVALRLPFIRRRRSWLDIIEFADLHLTDYNAPALGPAAPIDDVSARLLWDEVLRSLPKADLLRLTKMPLLLGSHPNPMSFLPWIVASPVNGNLIHIGDDWHAWCRSLSKPVRKELERSWRVFCRTHGTAFEIVTDPQRLQTVITAMERQQQRRMHAKGEAYILDQPEIARFYRDIIDRGVPSGYAVVTALTAGEEIVASLLGIRDGTRYIMIRISHASGHWSNCSPGRLIVERTMAAFHSQGCRVFDLSIGNYDYKRRFNVTRVPLIEMTMSLSLAGKFVLLAMYLRELRLRLSPERSKIVAILSSSELIKHFRRK